MLDLKNHFSSTYAKMLLTDWSVLCDLMQKETRWVKNTLHPQNNTTPSIISDQQINDALNGPFQHFFKPFLCAFAQITKLEAAITVSKADFFKDVEQAIDSTLGIPASFLEKIEQSAVKNCRHQLNELIQEHYAQWESHIQQWSETVIADLKTQQILLSDGEQQDFVINQPVSELQDRFIDLKIAPPKLGKMEFHFQQYFILKTTLAIHSALNRTQQPNTEKDIAQLFKKLKPTFDAIHQAEKTLQKNLQEAISPIMTSFTWNHMDREI